VAFNTAAAVAVAAIGGRRLGWLAIGSVAAKRRGISVAHVEAAAAARKAGVAASSAAAWRWHVWRKKREAPAAALRRRLAEEKRRWQLMASACGVAVALAAAIVSAWQCWRNGERRGYGENASGEMAYAAAPRVAPAAACAARKSYRPISAAAGGHRLTSAAKRGGRS